MRLTLIIAAALAGLPTVAHAEPVTAAIFGTAFASISSTAVSVAISISVSRAYSLLASRS